MNLTRCPKELDKHERNWWKFYLPVVTSRGLMTAGKYSTLKDLCSVETQIEYNMALLRESNYGATYQEAKYVDSSDNDHFPAKMLKKNSVNSQSKLNILR